MDGYKLGVVETRFAELIWQHEPLTSGELVKLCEQELQWKKSTTYTVLKNLANTGFFRTKTARAPPFFYRRAKTPYRAVPYTHFPAQQNELLPLFPPSA